MGHFFTKIKNQLSTVITVALLLVAFVASAQITVTAVATNTTCGGLFNGYGTAIASGGWAPYTYQWSNGGSTAVIGGLSAGTYTVTVTDIDGATGSATIVVTSAPTVGVTTFSQSQICDINPDGTATAVPYGGVPPYTYHWSNGGTLASITGLAAGTYTVTVTDAVGCTAVGSTNVLVFGNEGIWIGDSTVNVTCFGAHNGMAIAMPMSGTPPYTYQWSNGGSTMKINNLAPGNYTVTVTDANGCFGTHLFTITQPTDLTTVTGSTPAVCTNSGTATVTPVGGTPPYSIHWGNNQTTLTITNLAPGTYTATVTDANGCTEGATVTVTGSGTGLTITGTAQVPAGCNIGGSATLSISNGSGNYTYLWDNGQTTAVGTNLSVGNHTVTVIDNVTSCTGVGTVNIPQATPIITTIVVTTNATCSTGGSATASASGGVAPYTYLWSNGQVGANATNLTAGTYTVSVTDATGCVSTKSGVVTQTQGPSVTAQVTAQATCTTGGTATATATGGQPAYTYLWSNGATTPTATNLAPGIRTVTVTDANGCAASASVTITQSQGPSATAAVTAAATCLNGGSATVTATGGTTPYTYLWSNNATTATITNIAPGTYTVTVKDANNCTVTATATITAPPAPTVVISASTIANCNQPGSATAIAAGGVSPYSYHWSNGENTATATNLTGGTYTVTVTAANGCTATTTVTIGTTNNGITIGDFVWFDNDQDGFQGVTESTQGVAGIIVKLIKAGPDGFFGTLDDIVVTSTTTNAAGNYSISCVAPGTYILMFNGIPSGYEFTDQDAVNNDCLDSDVNGLGVTHPFTIGTGQANNLCFDAGIHVICQNIANPGAICCNQTICEGETPAALTEAFAPIGGSGALEYLWMQYIQIGQSSPQWYPITTATSSSYQPGPLTSTSYFMRCVRRAGCTTYSESNIITITVLPAGSAGCGGFSQNFSLKPVGPTSVEIEWVAMPENEQYMYTVQHSVNTIDWSDISTVMGHHNTTTTNTYKFLDQTPLSGVNFYRIMRTAVTGVQAYSEMKSIEIALSGLNAISIYPNPVHNTLFVKNIAKYDADVEIDITTANGELIHHVVIAKGAVELKNMGMEDFPAGIYFARIRFENGDVKTVKISKF